MLTYLPVETLTGLYCLGFTAVRSFSLSSKVGVSPLNAAST